MRLLALDFGAKRIGLAFADSRVRIAVPRGAVFVDGDEKQSILDHFRREKADALVVGYPRNSAGLPTQQTESVKNFVDELLRFFDANGVARPPIFYQDESLTSVIAEEHFSLKQKTGQSATLSRSERTSGAIDAEAATLFLQDFLENKDFSEDQMENSHA